MRRLQLFGLMLSCHLTACHGSEHDPHTHLGQSERRDAGDEAACAGRGEALTDVNLTAADAAIDATLTLVSATPTRPIVGNNSWVFDLAIDGEPASGLASAITVTPFMPDHGHGTPTIVRVEEIELGRYRIEPVHTRMAGYWEVTVWVETPASELIFVVKVCVD